MWPPITLVQAHGDLSSQMQIDNFRKHMIWAKIGIDNLLQTGKKTRYSKHTETPQIYL